MLLFQFRLFCKSSYTDYNCWVDHTQSSERLLRSQRYLVVKSIIPLTANCLWTCRVGRRVSAKLELSCPMSPDPVCDLHNDQIVSHQGMFAGSSNRLWCESWTGCDGDTVRLLMTVIAPGRISRSRSEKIKLRITRLDSYNVPVSHTARCFPHTYMMYQSKQLPRGQTKDTNIKSLPALLRLRMNIIKPKQKPPICQKHPVETKIC